MALVLMIDRNPSHLSLQWYLDPESMRLPAPTIPEGAPPAARQILETLAVRFQALGRLCRSLPSPALPTAVEQARRR